MSRKGEDKVKKKLTYLLVGALLLAQMPTTTFAQTNKPSTAQADLEVTLSLDYPVAAWEKLDLKIELLKDNKLMGTFPLKQEENLLSAQLQGQNYQVQTTPSESALHILFDDLPLGTYQVRLTGKGYKTYTSEPIDLTKTEKHLVLGTGNNTFTVGDVNQDGKVDEIDLEAMKKALESSDLKADFNGDDEVDVEDLAQLYWNQNAQGEAKTYNTKVILGEILDENKVKSEIETSNSGNVKVQGSVSSLFDGNDETSVELVSNVPVTEEHPIKVPVSFKEKVSVSQINIMAPVGSAPTAGYVVYEDENGKEVRQPFSAVSTYQTARTRAAQNVITINLGKQVPLQKLTIEVTDTNDEGGLLASISKIEFLEDVVDQAVNQEQGAIKGIKSKPINEGIVLSWNQVPNVTGYKISYGTESGVYEQIRQVGSNQITIEGLENFTPYYFVIQAVNGDWEGPLSSEIMAIPEPEAKPSAPTEVNVTPLNKGVKVSFKIGEDASGANLYYKKETDASYTVMENINSGVMVRGLENNVAYMFYVTATNTSGESGPSKVVTAIPTEEELVMPEIPTHNRIDNTKVKEIHLLDASNVDKKFYPEGFKVENIMDGDFTTHWTAETYQKARGFSATFDQPYEMDYVAFVPRLDTDFDRHDGTRKYWEYASYYGIKVWETLDSEPKVLHTKTAIPSIGKDGLMILPFEKTKVAKIEVNVFEWDGAGNMSISEVMFYEYFDLIERIDNLFANGTYTKLNSNVKLEDIEKLEKELDALGGAVLFVDKDVLKEELQLAKDLLTPGSTAKLGQVVEVVQTRDKSTANDKNFAMPGLSDLQPAGVMALADDEIVVYVDAPEGGTLPEMVFTQFFGDGNWEKSVQLKQGRNVIKVPKVVNYNITKGGPIYLRYNGEPQDTTTVRIVHAKDMPTLEVLDLTQNESTIKDQVRQYITELTGYVSKLDKTNLEKNPHNVTEIGTDKILLSLPAEEVLRGITSGIEGNLESQVERLYESLMTWDANMKLHYAILGLSENAAEARDRYPATRINIRYMPMSNGIFMYAEGTHIGIQYRSGAGLVSDTRSSQDGYFGWGINHEIGHVINDEAFVTAEVTNNIFSIFAQTINGGQSRLENSGVYPKIYQKVTSKDTGFASDVFVSLGMFWQLHLAYDDAEGVGTFYPKLHQLSRSQNIQNVDKHNYFVRIASDAAQKDLTPFFERWGIKITPETYKYTEKYQKETRAIYYLNDEARRYRLNKGTGMNQGDTVDIKAQVVQGENTLDKEVELTLSTTMNQDALLGYEIYRDGELIGFTEESTYRDPISANNVTHTYSAVAYDKLLNHTPKAEADEVYIATDGTIARSEFTMERTTPGSLTITLPNTPEVVGLKLTDVNVTTDEPYQVEISQDGVDWHVAKNSKLKAGTQYIYFNKPGTKDDDDRIWSYDAKYIRITGKPIETLSEDKVDVLAYPGDAVYFTDGAIGYLGHDYNFGSGSIPEGTLVVMGSYRGHPIYSKIVVSAEYVNEKDFDSSERPNYDKETKVEAVEGEIYMFAEVPEDQQVSKVGNGIWMFIPKEQSLPAQIKANMFRTDEASSIAGGRLVSDTKWLLVPNAESLPTINLQ